MKGENQGAPLKTNKNVPQQTFIYMSSRKCLQLLILFFLFLVFLITHTFPRSVAESLRKITNFELRTWLFQWLQEELISKLFLCKAIYLRHDAPGTAGTAAAVPEFFHCLVGFSWCREKFYFLYVWMNHKFEISSKKINT